MPRKTRELEAELRQAGFVRFPAKGSHRKWVHPRAKVTISGNPGDDAKHYQEEQVREALRKARQ